MTVKLKPINTIKASLGIEPNGKIQKFFTNECYKEMDEFVPMDNNLLRRNVSLTASTITYQSPYAHYQYVGEREDGTHKVVNYTTPGTGTYWDKRMWTSKGEDIVKRVQKKVDGK